MNKESIAKLCHQVNKAYCESIGDTTQVDWGEAPEWQKESFINGVDFLISNENAKQEDIHNSWLKEKESAGWKYGEIKDVEKKEHPCLVLYDQLPVEQKSKDYIFKAICDFFKEN